VAVIRNFILLTIVTGLLTACGSDGLDDLREFVNNAHKNRKPRVEQLPEVKAQQKFSYSAEEGTDPFGTFNLKPRGTSTASSGPRPDLNRRREPLEDYPLDSLKMVGTLTRSRQSWVVLQAPDGTVHRAQVGNHIGQNFGRVVTITEAKVELVELVQNPLGDWIERKASLSIEE